MKVYIDWRDWWIGWYRGPDHNYVCPLPCVVVRWPAASRAGLGGDTDGS